MITQIDYSMSTNSSRLLHVHLVSLVLTGSVDKSNDVVKCYDSLACIAEKGEAS